MPPGIETLGVFHPHWLSASRISQRDLISRYIAALGLNSPKSQEKFIASLRLAEPFDVAAVLKWGLRHLALEQGSFGKDGSSQPWAWYTKFATAERAASFPNDAFTSQLLPLLPPSHAILLKDLLSLLSSVAAHAQGNGMFNTKLCKVLAWWLVSPRRWDAGETGSEGWTRFYEAWDRASRVLEHVMLAYLRYATFFLRLHLHQV